MLFRRNRTPILATLIVLAVQAVTPAMAQQQGYVVVPYPDIGVEARDEQARLQRAQSAGMLAFHDFQFVDRLPESGITFRHAVVDDAARNFVPAHYDHGNGLAVADVDGDRHLDVYFVNQLGRDELWRNRGDGTFENISLRAGIGSGGRPGVTASFADIDNDGDADLFTTSVRGGNTLYENDGTGRFTDITLHAGVEHHGHSSGVLFLDFDRDGLLDLFVANVGSYTSNTFTDLGFPRARPDAFFGHMHADRAETSLLYRNQGNGRFREVSAEMGLIERGWTGDASIVDFNRDGYPDLYVLNMQGDDRYWLNEGGARFVERTAQTFEATPWGSMGVKSFDFDNDGDLDLFVTDMHSDMSTPVDPGQGHLKAQPADRELAYAGSDNNILGNAFYRNDAPTAFAETSDLLALETYWPWGTSVGDVNADGWQDVFITASMSYPFRYHTNTLRLNNNGEKFVPAEYLLGIEPRRDDRVRTRWFDLDCAGPDRDRPECQGRTGVVTVLGTLGSRSSAIFDLDRDGDLDIVTNEFNAEPQVLVSDLSTRREIRWLKIWLEGTDSNRDAIGARVSVYADGRAFTQFHDGKSGYLSQSAGPLYFGLGEAEQLDGVTVTWPSGRRQTFPGPIAANQDLMLREGCQDAAC